jgi:hypothetical protein
MLLLFFLSSQREEMKNNNKINMIFDAVLRTIWITRKYFFFNRSQWIGMQGLWRHLVCSSAQWKIMMNEEGRGELSVMLSKVEEMARLPPLLLWPEPG